MQKQNIKKLTLLAMFAALSSILMYFEFPLPFLPPFLKLDLSDIPVLIGALFVGPAGALAVVLVKDLIHLTVTQTGGVGELADFLITCSLVLPIGFIYKYKKTKLSVFAACFVGIVSMIIVGVLANKYLLIPFYAKLMPIDAIVAMCHAVNPNINGIDTYLLFGVAPFNLIKGLVVTGFTVLVFRKLSQILNSIGNKKKAQ